MTDLPKSRQSDIVIQMLDKELLIYNTATHKAFCLNETSTIVFQACAEGKTFEDLEQAHQYPEDLIYLTLDSLAKENLIIGEYRSKLAGISRREAIRKVSLATMIALPFISSLVAPRAVDAASACINAGGEAPGTTVSVSTTNPTNNTTTNQNFAGSLLRTRCCNNSYRDFVSNGCSDGAGATCNASAICI